MSRNHDDGLLFAGTVYARNRRIEGSGFYDIGNTTGLSIKSDAEKIQRTSKRKDSYGQPLDSLANKKPSELSYTLDTFDRTNLAMALMGEAAVIEAKAVKVTDEAVTVGNKGQWYKISIDNIDGKVTVKNAADQAVKPEYIEVNATLGMILIKEECDNVNNGETVKVTASTGAKGGFMIEADTVGDYDLEIMLDGVNRVSGENVKLHIPSAVVSSDSELDWFADDFNEASFTGNPVLVDGNKSGYTVKVFSV
ncbi:hypothetical protein ACFPVS_08980 [Neisseria weixii]|uniref:phage tail tube protein n=1 Tax=Neisseria weixii TaxID=1853276 RepID=UPI0036226C1B